MSIAGETNRQLAQQPRNKAFLRFCSAGFLAIFPFLVAPLMGTAGLKVLVFAVCFGGAFGLVRGGLKLWKQAKNADEEEKPVALPVSSESEEEKLVAPPVPSDDIALLLRELETEGWQIEYDIPVRDWGKVDAFLCSPSGNCFVVDTKSHGGTVFFDGTKLMRRYGHEVYKFNRDLLKAAKGRAVAIQKLKGVRYVTPILYFTKADLDIKTVDNLIEKVYVAQRESLVRRLKRLGKIVS